LRLLALVRFESSLEHTAGRSFIMLFNDSTQDRRGLFPSLPNDDHAMEIATCVIKVHTAMDVMGLQPHLNEFFTGDISLIHLQFAYMLLLARRHEC
jgi:hypothetical protein